MKKNIGASKFSILGDWGSSSCRLHLYDGANVIDAITGPGIKFTANARDAFFEIIDPWLLRHGPMPVVFSGMVGANIGWRDAGYVECPAGPDDLVKNAITFVAKDFPILIASGLKSLQSPLGLPDLMRGEETQIMGWLTKHSGDTLLCLPGTHTKWVEIKDGQIVNFITSLNGELFDILCTHSLLIGQRISSKPATDRAFDDGIKITAPGDIGLSHLLFSVRSQQICEKYSADKARNYLLGLLIGHDIQSALTKFTALPVVIVGEAGPAEFYAHAFTAIGRKASIYDGKAATLAGLKQFQQKYF